MRVLDSNLIRVQADGDDVTRVLKRRLDLPRGLEALPASWPRKFDVVFADPPYAFDAYELLLELCAAVIVAEGLVVVEHDARVAVESGPLLEQVDTRRYGDSSMTTFAPLQAPP